LQMMDFLCSKVKFDDFTGNAAFRRGARNGFSFNPACFITSEAFLDRLMKGKEARANDNYHHPASVPADQGEQLSLLLRQPDQPDNAKILKVAIIGAPNAGKSTLSNQLLGRKVFAVSKKVHTTRSRALGVLTERDTQIILLDTPGLTTAQKVKRHHLEKSLLVDPWTAVKEADLMVVLVDVSDRWMCSRLDFEVMKCLAQHPNIPAILVLNKVDLVKAKDRLLDITAQLTCGMVNGHRIRIRPVIKPPWAKKRQDTPLDMDSSVLDNPVETKSGMNKEQLNELRSQLGWPNFKDVFMLSCVDKESVETLKHYFLLAAKPGVWQYHSEVLTDQRPEDVCTNIIREKLLEYLPEEVPYSVTQSIDLWQEEEEEGGIDIFVKLYTKKESHMKMVIGVAGQMVARIAQEAGEDLSRVYLQEVRLKLSVKLRK
uniref:GTPase Era, mitochondrial n=1 Tax=Gouania willdenowi TaxID=441366 RepID=A0A8C5GQT0_GOUWI